MEISQPLAVDRKTSLMQIVPVMLCFLQWVLSTS